MAKFTFLTLALVALFIFCTDKNMKVVGASWVDRCCENDYIGVCRPGTIDDQTCADSCKKHCLDHETSGKCVEAYVCRCIECIS
ncbi:unnamed protein product [Lactuca virosa]|uniref:Defensin-like protein n=1 Tax=Lactuca virosa TaxID=75947 RepID=A0AAU9NZR8_9ASTR|nr:unnamed protein product [Lactuca virosa]